MRNKNPKAFRLSPDAIKALNEESERTGKSQTSVIEDMLLFRRQFNDDAEAAVKWLSTKHKIAPRRVVEVCVLKAAGLGESLPFEQLLAA